MMRLLRPLAAWPMILAPFAAVALLLLLGGCAPTYRPQAASLVLCGNMAGSESRWRDEAARRYPGCLVLMCHGDNAGGLWTCYPDKGPPMPVEGVARLLHTEHPGREIVLVTCNPGGAVLNVPGVAYPADDVWYPPRKPVPFGVNSIDQFREGDPNIVITYP
jgi:hypothetical protein